MKLLAAALIALSATACGGGGDRPRLIPAPPTVNTMDASAWEIGPVIGGEDKSTGVPLHPSAVADGWGFTIPPAPGSVHYVTARLGSLTGKHKLVLRYRIETDDDAVEVRPITAPGLPSMLTLYFQRKGDDWSARGKFETYRWYASGMSTSPVEPGEFELSIPLECPGWTAVLTSTCETSPAEFAAAKANADRVGFVFGGGTGLGHGVYATAPARFIVTRFAVE